jgi:hypothetical protein
MVNRPPGAASRCDARLHVGRRDRGDVGRRPARRASATFKLFTRESKSGKDGDLKNVAGTTLPTLEDHLSTVMTLSKSMT